MYVRRGQTPECSHLFEYYCIRKNTITYFICRSPITDSGQVSCKITFNIFGASTQECGLLPTMTTGRSS